MPAVGSRASWGRQEINNYVNNPVSDCATCISHAEAFTSQQLHLVLNVNNRGVYSNSVPDLGSMLGSTVSNLLFWHLTGNILTYLVNFFCWFLCVTLIEAFREKRAHINVCSSVNIPHWAHLINSILNPSSCSLAVHLPPKVTTVLMLILHIHFACFWTLYKWNMQYMLSTYFLASFIRYYICEIYSCCLLSVACFFTLSYFIFWFYHNLFNLFYSWTSGSFPLSFNNFSTEKRIKLKNLRQPN